MQSSNIGSKFAIGIIAAFLIWSAVRTLGARPPAAPNAPMPKPAVDEQLSAKISKEKIVLAGGCFWGVQGVFEHVKGVSSVTSGYAGGHGKDPSYELVSTGLSGHAESVEVTYDRSQISLGQLLMIYFSVAHDPTQLNRQGPDTGSQYRSEIFYTNDEQKRIADAYIDQLNAAKIYPEKIVTKVEKSESFYQAEGYHQDFLKNNPDNPYIAYNDMPKIENLKKQFPTLYREY